MNTRRWKSEIKPREEKGQTGEQTNRWTDRQTNEKMDRQSNRRMDGQKDGYRQIRKRNADRQTNR